MASRTDSFNRADSAVSLGTPSDGLSAWVADVGTWGVSGNRGYCPSGTGGASARLAGAAAVVNVKAAFAVAVSDRAGVTVRAADASNYWFVQYRTNNTITLFKRVAGSNTTVVNVTGQTMAAGDTIEVDVDASNVFRVYKTVSGTRTLIGTSAADSALASNTGVGLLQSFDNVVRFEDFVATDPAASAPTPTDWMAATSQPLPLSYAVVGY